MLWIDEETYRKNKQVYQKLGAITLIWLGLMVIKLLIDYVRDVDMPRPSQYPRVDTEFHTLPADYHESVDYPKQVTIDDRSPYAEDDTLELYQYTCCYYDEGRLTAEVNYDQEGSMFQLNFWEYDAAGNICREQSESETDGVQTRRHFYECDSSGSVVHEAIYQNEKLIENNYFRDTDAGRAGVSYSYLNDQVDGGIASYCSSHTEFIEDENGNLLYAFQMPSLDVDIPNRVWKMQWAQENDRIVNRVQYYVSDFRTRSISNWYQDCSDADGEQVNLYVYDPEAVTRNQTLQLNYEWQSDQDAFCLTDSFYRARYDGDILLWQMAYSDDRLTYYNVCQYDTERHLQSSVEYIAEEEETYPYTVFHRYIYPAKDREEQYSYYIQGKEFRYSFGEGESVLLTFDELGTLSAVEMTDSVGNLTEKYEFRVVGRDYGKLHTMYIGTDEITGEEAILIRMEEEAESYGFRVGENLESNMKGSAE